MEAYTGEVIYVSTAENLFSVMEKHHDSPHKRRCINGRMTGCGKTVGYCRFSEHPGYLTKELRKEHNCIKKGCDHYSPKREKTGSTPQSNPFSVLDEAFRPDDLR